MDANIPLFQRSFYIVPNVKDPATAITGRPFLLLPPTDDAPNLLGLNLVRCGTRNIFRLSDNISPQGGRPTFILFAQYEA